MASFVSFAVAQKYNTHSHKVYHFVIILCCREIYYFIRTKCPTPCIPGSSSWSTSPCFFHIPFLHQSVLTHLLQFSLLLDSLPFCVPPSLLVFHHVHHCFLPNCLPHYLVSNSIHPCQTIHTLLKHIDLK